MKKTHTVSFKVNQDLYEKFRKQAQSEQRSVSNLLRVIMEEYIENAKK